jgi:hypothetical protein
MEIGNKNRMVGSTAMNATSSRSHAIFVVTIECIEVGVDGENHIRVGKLNLVDLAGSERQKKTQATKERLEEGIKINQSLLCLGNVVNALATGAKGDHIPYRNSVLTKLLKDSLGGNAKTVMIANIGPSIYNYDETVNTLRCVLAVLAAVLVPMAYPCGVLPGSQKEKLTSEAHLFTSFVPDSHVGVAATPTVPRTSRTSRRLTRIRRMLCCAHFRSSSRNSSPSFRGNVGERRSGGENLNFGLTPKVTRFPAAATTMMARMTMVIMVSPKKRWRRPSMKNSRCSPLF